VPPRQVQLHDWSGRQRWAPTVSAGVSRTRTGTVRRIGRSR
jgi:hypothetical protein